MSREARVGVMFTVAVGITLAALYYLGSFQEQVTYRIRFEKVLGLARDSPVQFNGVSIGRVTKIELGEQSSPDANVAIIVTIAVHRSVREHIRQSTTADIKSVGILGDKSISLMTGNYSADVLEEGGFIKPAPKMLDMEKLLEQGSGMVSDATSITENLRSLLDKMNNQDGPFQRFIGDEKMADDMRNSFARLLGYLENENSLLALLMKDDAFAATVKGRIDVVSANLEGFSDELKNGDGLLPLLLEDPQFRDEVRAKVLEMMDAGAQFANNLNDGRGLLHKLTQDEAYAERVAGNLDKASYHLASILEKIDEGDGSASLMINDPSLYQGVYEVVYGLQHSGLSKWYLQKKQKRGEKMLKKNPPEETDPTKP